MLRARHRNPLQQHQRDQLRRKMEREYFLQRGGATARGRQPQQHQQQQQQQWQQQWQQWLVSRCSEDHDHEHEQPSTESSWWIDHQEGGADKLQGSGLRLRDAMRVQSVVVQQCV